MVDVSDLESQRRLVGDFKHWVVLLNRNQSYLGRCVILSKHAGQTDIAQCKPPQVAELHLVLRLLRGTMRSLFHPDKFNVGSYGMVVPDLHFHFAPRYREPRNFDGIRFEDKKWGDNPWPSHEFKISGTVMLKLRNAVRKQLAERQRRLFRMNRLRVLPPRIVKKKVRVKGTGRRKGR